MMTLLPENRFELMQHADAIAIKPMNSNIKGEPIAQEYFAILARREAVARMASSEGFTETGLTHV